MSMELIFHIRSISNEGLCAKPVLGIDTIVNSVQDYKNNYVIRKRRL